MVETAAPSDRCYLCQKTSREQQYLKATEEKDLDDNPFKKCEECCSRLRPGVLDEVLLENESLQHELNDCRLQLHEEGVMMKMMSAIRKEKKLQEKEKLIREEEERENRMLKQTILSLRIDLASREKDIITLRKQLKSCTCLRFPKIGTDSPSPPLPAMNGTFNTHRLSVDSSATVDTIGEDEDVPPPLSKPRSYPAPQHRTLGPENMSSVSLEENENMDELNELGHGVVDDGPNDGAGKVDDGPYDDYYSVRSFRPVSSSDVGTYTSSSLEPSSGTSYFSKNSRAMESSRSMEGSSLLSRNILPAMYSSSSNSEKDARRSRGGSDSLPLSRASIPDSFSMKGPTSLPPPVRPDQAVITSPIGKFPQNDLSWRRER
mmetsp:Transcript_19301/g.31600  ORF Transcript_19301/g.31600 Transcript_19301/m.31600 type:complete len:376 (+) Transcript_19301:70-1197(+)|eukprot:CAMPEP_0184333914 /NCGR_PEP_ID=MMETSP1089-20130417/2860_1 /TAXON_ID=38269 ORGANISM="Gloeochaete wittrockiana, Strain SAG46.84" /NCGR_SAMPLE_ID=MMETSP1089 /ASSEMBLY_ACC=CAM_ASM_000445 /LENGTH=375 /DNA_ID=CAMNT_0026658003 /DNA_START=63 /DNA_END=1190 /DNA_ORIENTATION=+